MLFEHAPDKEKIGVFYLARGADENAYEKFRAFRDSYERFPSGYSHALYIVYKGFSKSSQLETAGGIFSDLPHEPIYLDDEWLDLGAYFQAASRISHCRLCFLNTSSRILGAAWLAKLSANLTADVGMVGCTGNYEAPLYSGLDNVQFPNVHLRSTGILVRRQHFLQMQPAGGVTGKMEAYMLEHGPHSFTRMLASKGLTSLVVGRNGRGYSPERWLASQTFRTGRQSNLLIADNQTSRFHDATPHERRVLFELAWGSRELRSPKAIADALGGAGQPSGQVGANSQSGRWL